MASVLSNLGAAGFLFKEKNKKNKKPGKNTEDVIHNNDVFYISPGLPTHSSDQNPIQLGFAFSNNESERMSSGDCVVQNFETKNIDNVSGAEEDKEEDAIRTVERLCRSASNADYFGFLRDDINNSNVCKSI